jgi:hypothetical protein
VFFITPTTTQDMLANSIRVKVRFVRQNRIDVSDIALPNDYTEIDLKAAVDTLDDQLGEVLDIHRVDAEGNKSEQLYKSMFEPWDLERNDGQS